MQLKQLELAGGGMLTVYLRDCCERMPNVLDRPLVLVVPGGGYTHVSAREGDPVALQFAAAGYHTAVLSHHGPLEAGIMTRNSDGRQEERATASYRPKIRHCTRNGWILPCWRKITTRKTKEKEQWICPGSRRITTTKRTLFIRDWKTVPGCGLIVQRISTAERPLN